MHISSPPLKKGDTGEFFLARQIPLTPFAKGKIILPSLLRGAVLSRHEPSTEKTVSRLTKMGVCVVLYCMRLIVVVQFSVVRQPAQYAGPGAGFVSRQRRL